VPGPMCRVCSSPMRKEIDAALLDGTTSLREITARYGIPKSTAHKHKVNCMGAPTDPNPTAHLRRDAEKREKLAATSRVAYLESKLPTREELGATLESVVTRLDRIVSKHETDGGTDVVALKGLAEMRSTVSELAKLAGHVGAGSTQQINVGVQVSMSAKEIASELALRLGAAPPIEIREAIAADYTCEAVSE
jgi:hypothetical protein